MSSRNRRHHSDDDPEQSYKLLRLTDSDAADNASKEALAPHHETASLNVPPMRGLSAFGEGAANGKVRRKVRLKRKQRDNRVVQTVGSSTGTENASNSDSEVDPTCHLYLCCPGGSHAGHNKRSKRHRPVRQSCLRHSTLVALALTVIAVILIVVSYFCVILQGQVTSLSLHLQPLLEDRKNAVEGSQEMHLVLASLLSNHTRLATNYSALAGTVNLLNVQFQQLNASVAELLTLMSAAPYMKSLPGDVKEVKKDVAKFGSRLTEMESQLSKAESDLTSGLVSVRSEIQESKKVQPVSREGGSTGGEFRMLLANRSTELEAEIKALDSKFVRFGTEMSQQLERQEKRSSNSWTTLGEIQDDIRNVSAKSLSNDVKIQRLSETVKSLNERLDKAQAAKSPPKDDPE